MNPGMPANPRLSLAAQTANSITIAELTGELDIASAPALRDQLLGLLRPSSSRLVIDLSKVSFCDASGLAVLVNTARRARLLGGFLRLAAVSPQVGRVLNITGLHQHLANFLTVQDAVTGAQTAQHRKSGHHALTTPAATLQPPAAKPAKDPRASRTRERRHGRARRHPSQIRPRPGPPEKMTIQTGRRSG